MTCIALHRLKITIRLQELVGGTGMPQTMEHDLFELRAFDRLWRSGLMTKKEAYQWMQTEFGLHEEQAHIAQFGAYMCDRLICACDKFRIHGAEVA